jgi:hypothetical protein
MPKRTVDNLVNLYYKKAEIEQRIISIKKDLTDKKVKDRAKDTRYN